MRSMHWDLFSVIGCPRKRYAVTLTRMPVHNCLPGPHLAASVGSCHVTKNKVPRPDGGVSISLHDHTARANGNPAPQLLLLCPQTSFPHVHGSGFWLQWVAEPHWRRGFPLVVSTQRSWGRHQPGTQVSHQGRVPRKRGIQAHLCHVWLLW
jgi:hypothetical protein